MSPIAAMTTVSMITFIMISAVVTIAIICYNDFCCNDCCRDDCCYDDCCHNDCCYNACCYRLMADAFMIVVIITWWWGFRLNYCRPISWLSVRKVFILERSDSQIVRSLLFHNMCLTSGVAVLPLCYLLHFSFAFYSFDIVFDGITWETICIWKRCSDALPSSVTY